MDAQEIDMLRILTDTCQPRQDRLKVVYIQKGECVPAVEDLEC